MCGLFFVPFANALTGMGPVTLFGTRRATGYN